MSAQTHAPAANRSGATQDATKAPATVARAARPARRRQTAGQNVLTGLLTVLSLIWVIPLLFILLNSLKGKFYISDSPFSLPTGETFAGLDNYVTGLQLSGFARAIGWSLFITVGSVAVIVLLTAMTAYYITRVKTWWTSLIYYLFAFSMIAPFQLVMFPTVKIADTLGLATPWGMIVLYLGFGGGLSVFLFAGFIKSVPMEIEEAAYMDGCSPLQSYFRVVMPLLKPTSVTVAVLNAMWVWNDFLLPNLVIGQDERYKTIPIVIQMLVGSNGNRDMGAQMAMLVLAIIPIVIFYLFGQKHIVEGVAAGAVKG
ncbi:MAG: carbohydrate ABC transporter permease [Actinomyces urogenitalis]|uniref:carbohydrate ABC transporter permease n=1 Tax=Actinomyces urogenitalis TaxID=103621 RepID=UPI00242FEE4E|nr:carbohydrate ABC transporter permease [Actinomyces urogenitalis]MCI7456749.1 carbohydrate ABC transporter permease [Actinomyces urogenitalis]MDY3678693.1 carbohydrate ABC transporter permease [Actinomyces urogenitalis]